MAKSVGNLNAMLSLSTRDWSAGLDKARRDIDSFRARVSKQTGVDIGDMFGGGGMGSIRDSMAVRMKRQRESYMGRGTLEQQSWQSSLGGGSGGAGSAPGGNGLGGILNTAIKLEAVSMGIRSVLSGTVAITKAMEGNWEGALEAARRIPIFGEAIGSAIEFRNAWNGKDIKDKYEAIAKEESKMRSDLAERQKKTSGDMAKESADIAARNAIAPLEGVERELAEIELRRAQAIDEATERFKEFKGLQSQAMKDGQRALLDQINQRAQIESQVAMREDSEKKRKEEDELAKKKDEEGWERTKKLYDLDSQIAQSRLRMAGKNDDAERYATAARYEEQIAEAKRAGDTEMSDRLTMLRDLEMKESRIRQRKLQEVDFSAMAGTGAINAGEKTRDVLMSIDRGIKRGVVARAA